MCKENADPRVGRLLFVLGLSFGMRKSDVSGQAKIVGVLVVITLTSYFLELVKHQDALLLAGRTAPQPTDAKPRTEPSGYNTLPLRARPRAAPLDPQAVVEVPRHTRKGTPPPRTPSPAAGMATPASQACVYEFNANLIERQLN